MQAILSFFSAVSNIRSLPVFISFFLCPAVLGQSNGDRQLAIKSITTELLKVGSTNVVRLEVFYFPEDIETEFAIGPEDLEKSHWAKITIAEFQRSNFRESLLRCLDESEIRKRNGGSKDVRWGCVFFDSKGNRIASLYLDQFGKGELNGIQIRSNSKILRLLQQKCAFR
jgi:hypothetical protein